MNIGPVELLLLTVLWIIPAFVLYGIIRLGVRHGMMDAQRKL